MSTPAGWETTGEFVRFRAKPHSIRGSIAPLVTPFAADGSVDLDSLRRLVRWQLECGSHGISIGGSTGEPSAQTVDERIAAMRVVAEETAERVPFLPGTGSAKLDETLALTAAARDLGADAALVITPYYARPTQDGLYEWYATVAREFRDLPIVLYNVPIRTAVDVAPETLARLRRDSTTSSASRRRRRTSSTSRACSTCAGATRWCGLGSSCSACRCWRSAGSASSAPLPTSPRARSRACTSYGLRATTPRPSTSTTACIRSSI